MKYFPIFLLFVPQIMMASSGPKEVTLNPDLARELGFSIIVTPEGGKAMVELKGPNKSPSGCPAKRSGSFLLGKDGQELFVYITELPKTQAEPQAVGYFSNKEHTMGVFIDYLCSGAQALKSTRYSVPSISDWLITWTSN